MQQLKYGFTMAISWLGEDPQRVRLTFMAASALLAIVGLIAGLSPQGTLVAGPAPGMGGGPE